MRSRTDTFFLVSHARGCEHGVPSAHLSLRSSHARLIAGRRAGGCLKERDLASCLVEPCLESEASAQAAGCIALGMDFGLKDKCPGRFSYSQNEERSLVQ